LSGVLLKAAVRLHSQATTAVLDPEQCGYLDKEIMLYLFVAGWGFPAGDDKRAASCSSGGSVTVLAEVSQEMLQSQAQKSRRMSTARKSGDRCRETTSWDWNRARLYPCTMRRFVAGTTITE
jgi:hypothetical protein